jgi:Ca2+-binding EF-hand superfamily protein
MVVIAATGELIMVESTSTTPSETGNTWAGGTTDFSSQLDAGTLAAVSDPKQSGGGIESLAPGTSEPTEIDKVISQMFAHDTGNPDTARRNGMLEQHELMKAIYFWNGAATQDGYQELGVATQLANAYGDKEGYVNTRQISLSVTDVKQMFTDGVLFLPAGYVIGRGNLGVNLDAIPINRVIHGASYGELDAAPDGLINKGELVALFATLGHTVSSEQAHFLLHVYGDGDVMSQADAKRMRDDGFLNTGTTLGDAVMLNWDNIDGGLIADALCGQLGLAVGTTLEAVEFDIATDMLFGNTAGVNSEQAVFLTRIFGTGGKLNREQIAALFENNNISISGPSGQPWIGITVNTTADNVSFENSIMAANYIMLYDTNNDGLLYTGELRAAITSRLAAGEVLTDEDMNTYMDAYGEKRIDGNMSITRDGVLAMLNDSSLSMPRSGTEWPSQFDISLDTMPIDRVLRAASYGDSVSLNDGLISVDELIKLFAKLGITLTADQARFLTKVYSNGGTDAALITTSNVEKMREDGFLVINAANRKNSSVNWSAIDGTLIAREIFRSLGLDPNVENVSVDAESFSAGFKTLYGDMQTLKRADDLVGYFGFEDKLTVAQMGNALNAVNTDVDAMNAGLIDVSSESDGAGDASNRTLVEKNINTVFDYAEVAAADATITKISNVSGVAENVVRGMLRGTLTEDVAVANGGYNIVDAVSAAIAGGQAGISTIIDTISAALSSSLVGLSDMGTKVLNQLVTSAKAGGEEVAVRTLSMWAGMTVEDARAQIEDLANKGSLLEMANSVQLDQVTAMIPGADLAMGEAKARYNNLMANVQTDATTLQSLANEGYIFNSEKQLTKGGIILSEIETQSIFSKYARVDIAIDVNATTPLPDGISRSFANGAQVRFFFAYGGQNSNGEDKWEFRVRILTIGLGASTNRGQGYSSFGLDAGIATVHDLVIPLTVDRQILWNSSIAALGQFTTSGQIVSNLSRSIGVEIGPIPDPSGIPGRIGVETGVGAGVTVSYNINKLGDKWYVPFVGEAAGAIGGAVGSAVVAFNKFITLEAGQSALNYFRNNAGIQTTVSIAAMCMAFVGDLINLTAIRNTLGTDKARLAVGPFWWGAQLFDLYQTDVNGNSTKYRFGLQENLGFSPGSIS